MAKVRTKILEANDKHDIENIEDKVNAYLDSLQEGTFIDIKFSTVLHPNYSKTYTALIVYKTN